jgi:hypothetical protein
VTREKKQKRKIRKINTYFLATLKKNLANWLNLTTKTKPCTYWFCLSTGIPSPRLVDQFEGVDQLYETGGCHVGAMFLFGQFL